MKKLSVILFVIIASLLISGYYRPAFDDAKNPNVRLLKKHQTRGLPIYDYYKGQPGCYMLCFNKEGNGVYKVGDFSLHGLLRVVGSYPVSHPSSKKEERKCDPAGIYKSNSEKTKKFAGLCNRYFKTCNDKCFAGSDTGSFFFN